MASRGAPENDDVFLVVSEQQREFREAQALESDMDFAFHLQLQEALAASLTLHPSSAAADAPPGIDSIPVIPTAPGRASFHSEELVRLEQELKDRVQSEIEMRKARVDLNRRIHDDQVAREIMKIPEDEWQESGEFFAKPFGEGSSSAAAAKSIESESVFRLYSKGLVSEETVGDRRVVLAGIGVALCDPRDNLIFEVRKPLIGNGKSNSGAQLMALIEGLNAAIALDLKRINFFCENLYIFQFVNGRWLAKQRKIAKLVDQIKSLRGKFILCNPRLVPRLDIKFAFKLARDAIVSQSQPNQLVQSTTCKNVNENCVICLEDNDISQMFSVDGCMHRYCSSCMKQHVEVKLLHGMIPRCPHEGCTSNLSVDSCAKFLTPKYVETMRLCIEEASIPVTEKVYCPYPRCSALMSKPELLKHTKEALRDVERTGVRKCMKCHCLFCINCKVPWHKNRTCSDYKKLNPHPPEEDTKLKLLASTNLWRQCVKCNHLIELAEGCYHMTCRCGYQFCYNCGAEWKDKKATCSCPLWDQDNILLDEDDEDFDDSESDDYDSDSDDLLLNGRHPVCNDCGADWQGGAATCLCPPKPEAGTLFIEDTDYEEEGDEYESLDEDEDDEEVRYEDDDEEVLEEKNILSAEDDGDEEYEDDEDDPEDDILSGEYDSDYEVPEDERILSGEDDVVFEGPEDELMSAEDDVVFEGPEVEHNLCAEDDGDEEYEDDEDDPEDDILSGEYDSDYEVPEDERILSGEDDVVFEGPEVEHNLCAEDGDFYGDEFDGDYEDYSDEDDCYDSDSDSDY